MQDKVDGMNSRSMERGNKWLINGGVIILFYVWSNWKKNTNYQLYMLRRSSQIIQIN